MTKTHTMRSRLISLVLVLVMVLGCLPMSALAWDNGGRIAIDSFQLNGGNASSVPAILGQTYEVPFSLQMTIDASKYQNTSQYLSELKLSFSGDSNCAVENGSQVLAANLMIQDKQIVGLENAGAFTIDGYSASASATKETITISGSLSLKVKSAATSTIKVNASLYTEDALTEWKTATSAITFTELKTDDIAVSWDSSGTGTVASVSVNDTGVADTGSATVSANEQVKVEVTLGTDTELTGIYGSYTNADNNEVTFDLTARGGAYYFNVPAAEEFATAKAIELHLTTKSTAKTATEVELKVPANVTAGDTLTATATVKAGGAAITDAAGSIVAFTWPDDSVTTGYVSPNGVATASWAVTDDYANSLTKDNRDVKVKATYWGNEVYAQSSTEVEETVEVRSRTIKAGPGAAINANDGTNDLQSGLTVLQQYELSLKADAVVSTQSGVPLTKDTHYTVTWYENTGSGVWNKIDTLTVTPENINTQYKAVVKPTGTFTQGEFELVIGCAKLADSAVTVNTDKTTLTEGETLLVKATVTSNGGNASGGVVVFVNDEGTQLGTGNVINGFAKIELTNLAAGEHKIAARYLGAEGVYAASQSAAVTVTVKSAELEATGWSIKIEADGQQQTELQVGVENTLSIVAPNGYTGDDYRVEWLVSKDGGETWALAGTEDTLTVTPANKLYQYYAIVYPDGDYVAPAGGISVTKVTAAADAKAPTTIDSLSAFPNPVFEGQSFTLRAKVLSGNAAVTGGYVKFYTDDNSFYYEAPVTAGGYAECTVLAGVSEETTFKAIYTDSTGVYADATKEVKVVVKSTEIRFSSDAEQAKIQVSDPNYAVGDTVTLTAPYVYAVSGVSGELTVGKDFYYQWQYSTDYEQGEGADYTATWINFSAPIVDDDPAQVRVTIADANTAFRVVAMPYGSYKYPAAGVVTEAVCGNAGKIDTDLILSVISQEHVNDVYDGDTVQLYAELNEKDTGLALDDPEGYVYFYVYRNDGSDTKFPIGYAPVNGSGVASITYPVDEYVTGFDVYYAGSSKYNDSDYHKDVDVQSVTIALADGGEIAADAALTVGQAVEVTLPTVNSTDGEALTIGQDYYLQWLVDNGSGWFEAEKQYDASAYTFTPANASSKLACVAYPMGDYQKPAEGVACGVLTTANKIATVTTISVDSTDYEGDTAIVTASVKADGEAVLDGVVEFFVKYNTDDSTKYTFATARPNKNGDATATFQVPVYSAGKYQFYAHYAGTDVYEASNSGWSDVKTIKSATITFAEGAAIAIADANDTPVSDVQVGETYTLTAPEVYEKGTAKVLTCGTDYYYIWQYSADGSTWETVQSDVTAAGNVLKNAVFGNENAEYRAIAYPMGGSGSIYRYPANGIVVATSLNPALRKTTTTLEVSNYYAQTSTAPIFPVGRNITLTATVKDATDNDPAYGVVTFSYEVNGTSTTIGSVHLDPGGVATITVPAPATVNNNYSFKATYAGNEVYSTSNETAQVAVMPNEIELTGTLTIYAAGTTDKVTAPVVGTAYDLSGVTANFVKAGTYPAIAKAINAVQAAGVNPYYTYVWQKSEDGGVTWYNLDNAGDSNVLTDVVFETDKTQYRLAAYPVASSGWIAPAAGVFSDAVSVKTKDTEVAITMTDEAGVEISSRANRFENTEVNVTVNVSEVADYVEGSKGYVQLEVVRYHTGSTRETVYTTTGEVDNAGNATFQVTLPAYSYDPANLSNQVNFVATYSGDDHFTGSALNVGQAFVNLKSAAITWPQDAEDPDAFVKDITIYEGTDTSATGTTTDKMVANETYTLKLPTIYSGDVYSSSGTRKDVALTVNEDYTVVWQYRPMGETTNEWRTLDAASADTCVVICNEGQENYSYRAVITPMGDYTFAMDLDFGTLTSSNKLTSKPTADTELAATTTKLVITDTVIEAGTVEIAVTERNDKPFEDIGEHHSEYEGETITLTATVSNADGEVNDGNVFFYRYVDGGEKDVLLNEVGVEVDTNGVAKLENVVTSDWTDSKSVTDNCDKYYAVYEGTSVFDTSDSKADLETVYIRSTAIATPRFTVAYGDVTKTVSAYADTNNLPAATTMTFTLMDKAGSKNLGFSVTGTDGRWLTNGTDYSVQWYREEKTVDQGGVETGVVKPIEAATQVSYEKEASSLYQKYSLEAVAKGHMKTNAMSKQAIIGTTAKPVLDLDPGYTFTAADATFAAGVETTSGAHYGDQVTLTATVQGDATTNALPTGTVTFYYRTSDGAWTALSEPINLAQKDVSENDLVAVAAYTFNSSELPFNVDRIGYSYSGDDLYTAHEATAMQNGETSAANAKLPFKLWSVQISNPLYEGVDVTYTNYTDAACYPDAKAYDDVTITVYKATVTEDGKKFDFDSTKPITNGDVQAQSYYVLELDDVYTKSGEKLELAKDNSADITVEWYQSFDDGKTWSPVRVTEFTDATATQVCVKAEDSHVVYGVKVITTNSFYNSQMPELVDYGYSHKNIDVVRQHVNVSVEADAATPVADRPEWVYQRNPITLTATVTPTDQGEPSGFVKFEYAVVSALDLDDSGKPKVTGVVDWTEVVSDDENPTSKAELKPVDGTAYTDNTMVAELTTSNLPVTEDGTYSVILIKATYQGDDAYAISDNIDGNSSIIASPVVRVFSSVALQDKTNIENQVVTLGKNDEGVVTWSNGSASGTAYNGFLITGKDLVSDGTQTGIVLTDVYTLDVNDRTLDLFKDKADIYTLKLNVDYTVEWQYIENYQAYQNYVNGTDEGKSWQVVPNSTSTNSCAIDQVQSYAFRAKITMLDTAKAKAAYEEFDNYGTNAVDGERVIYSNILVVGDAEARVLTNIRKASSASVKGETVYIDAIIMGGTTTPVGNVTVTVTEKKSGEEVFSDNRNLVNGWTTFTWENVQAGEYTIKTVLTGNNGYVGETSKDYIVRFTDAAKRGDLTMSIENKTVTYDGQVQMLDASNVTINGFGENYTDWQALAESYVTFQYFDKDGNRVAEPVDAGTYTVKAYLPESMYWGYVTGTGTLTISQRPVTIADVTAQAKTYDGTNNVYVQNVELTQSAQDATTGLPTDDTGLVEGDSVYVDAKATVAANAGEQLLTVTEATLKGPDAKNYALNTTYSEKFVVSRNQLYGDAMTSITAAPGYQITDKDFYMIDQAGKQITAADATITYYYHTGNDILKVTDTNGEGKYTVVISMPESNYKGGLTTTLYIQKDAPTDRVGTVDKSATSALAYITDTNHVYDGTEKSVTVTTTKGTATVKYAGADGTYSTNKPVNAGRYMVKVETAGQTYYGVMTIVKGEPTFDFTADTVDYDGERYDATSLNLVETTGYNVLSAAQKYGALYYTYVGGSIVGYDYNAPRDVSYNVEDYDDSKTSGAYGAYMVTAHVPETANTIAVTPSATFEIKKIELKVIGDDVYTRLFDTHSKFTSTYEGFASDEYDASDSELRDLIALPTYQLGENKILSNADMSHVGYLTIHQSDVNARNYTLKYVNGDAAINVAPTQDQLEIRNDPATIYYGDTFQLFLYGSSDRDGDNVVQVNEASAVFWKSSDQKIATVDAQGNVNIIGVGQFTITATRGDDPDTDISISETYTAFPRRNDVVIERDDYLYDGQAKEIADANFSFYYMYHGTRFESTDPLSKDLCDTTGEPQIDSGEYPVTAKITGATKNVGDGAGLLAIHRVNSVVTPDGETAVYGNGFPGGDYTAAPIVSGDNLDDVLANGLVAADVRTNSDVDHYEILVAGGTEGWNYNVTYAPYAYSETNVNDFDVTQKTLTFTVGSLADTEGMTKNWREKDGTLAGTFESLPNAAFMNSDIRTFGELNQVLDYQTSDLITGDSIADLWDMSSRANANFAKLNDAYPFSVEGAANWKLNKTGEINYEYGTLDHEPMEGAIDDAAYIISGYTDSRNYAVTIATGRLDVEQRVVKMTVPTSGIVINGGEYTSEELAEAIANQMVIEGLAEKLDHIIKDLRLTVVEVTGSQTIVGGNKTYTLKIGNTNYCTEGGGGEIEVEVTVTNITAKATIYNSGATGFKVRIYGMFDGQTRPEHINELKYTILDQNTNKVVRTGTMTYVEDETFNGILQAVYETSYAQLPNGNYSIRFEAAGYSFSYY